MIATWIKQARSEAGLSGEALGAKLALELGTARGHTKANISHWETMKHSPSLQQLMAIAKVTGKPLPPAILANMGGSTQTADTSPLFPGAMRVVPIDQDDDSLVQIPMVKLRLSAGITGFQTAPEGRDGGTLGMRRSWIERKQLHAEHLIAILIKGESMEPTLYDGDTVILNTLDRKLVDGGVYAINYEGEAVVKRLTRDAGQWWLSSDNPNQQRFHRKLCKGSDCIVIGRVVRRESDHL